MWKAKEIAEDEKLRSLADKKNILKCAYCGLYDYKESITPCYIYKGISLKNICSSCIKTLKENRRYLCIMDEHCYDEFLNRQREENRKDE